MNIGIIGDVHGKTKQYYNRTKIYDKTLQVGDFGFQPSYNYVQTKIFQGDIDPNCHVFFGGNHDDYDHLPSWHLGDFGSVPFIDDSFFVRGAYSLDKDARIQGRDWWPEEQLNWKQMRDCTFAYEKAKPSIVFSHDGPDNITPLMFPEHQPVPTATGALLNELYRIHKPDIWIFGHWHIDKTYMNENTLFMCLGELSHVDLRSVMNERIEICKINDR